MQNQIEKALSELDKQGELQKFLCNIRPYLSSMFEIESFDKERFPEVRTEHILKWMNEPKNREFIIQRAKERLRFEEKEYDRILGLKREDEWTIIDWEEVSCRTICMVNEGHVLVNACLFVLFLYSVYGEDVAAVVRELGLTERIFDV